MKVENNGEGSLRPDAEKVNMKNHAHLGVEGSAIEWPMGTREQVIAEDTTLAKNTRQGTYRADIEVPATKKAFARLVHVDLDESETAQVQELADRCKMTIDAFVRAYLIRSRHKMTAWDYSRPPKVRVEAVTIAATTSKRSRARLERAAALWGQTVEEFVADAINCAIVGSEDEMLLNPNTGELLGHNEIGSLLRRNEEATAPCLREQRGEASGLFFASNGQPSRVAVVLDEEASGAARACLAGNNHAQVDHMGDLVNAAVEFFCDTTDEGTPTSVFVEMARERRLGAKEKGGNQ